MNLELKIQWQSKGSEEEIDPRLLHMLNEIAMSESLKIAADEVGVSYRTAWQIIEYWNEQFGQPLCEKKRGKGTVLTALGEKLVSAKQQIDTEFANKLHAAAYDLNYDIKRLTDKKVAQPRIVVYTSHDLAINLFAELCGESSVAEFEFISRGSIDALKQLHATDNRIAGFHFPAGDLAKELLADYSSLFDDNKFDYIHLAKRQQGLMFRSSLKSHIKGVNDLTRRSVSFINRQKGSGTRLVFDRLLQREGIKSKDIQGYKNEEFTHTAVAAMVSSNHADVGFGLRAAASEFKLAFTPILEEHYLLAMSKRLPKSIAHEIRNLIKSPKLKTKINKLTGYDTSMTGKLVHTDKLISEK